MTAYIIEDEPMARRNLERILHDEYPEIEVVGTADSVEEAVGWLKTHQPQLVFMDIQLSDGSCFDIFEETEIRCPFIITTAYDQYALQAFEAGSIDYLLKPVTAAGLKRAVSRCLQRSNAGSLGRMLLRVGGIIYPVSLSQVAFAYAQERNTFIVTTDNQRFQLSQSLEDLAQRWDSLHFFRISRSCLVARNAIREMRSLPGGRYALTTDPPAPFEVEVSRGRAKDFIHWLEHPL
jgi:DNA-binding LytR/AlgR family response regulator